MPFVRYALIGGLATGAHYVLLLALVEGLGLSPSLSAASGAACGALFAYAGNRRFTFISSRAHRAALPRFLFVAAFGAGLNGGLVWAATTAFAWHYLVAQVATTFLVLLVTYSLSRSWTFA